MCVAEPYVANLWSKLQSGEPVVSRDRVQSNVGPREEPVAALEAVPPSVQRRDKSRSYG